MAFVDTNIVLRWILGDDKLLTPKAEKLVDAAKPGSLIITDVVVAEVVYVLRGTGRDRMQTVEALEFLMRTPSFTYENEELTQDIMGLLGSTKLDYADCYLVARALRSGAGLATFDVAMRKKFDRLSV